MNRFQNPYSDNEMVYNFQDRRYILTSSFVQSQGVNLNLLLQTIRLANPNMAIPHFLNRVSKLVYGFIYGQGRTRPQKEYMLACNPDLRNVIRDAMMERVLYMLQSGDLSLQSGAIIQDGIRVEVANLIPSVVENQILLNSGILHRGKWSIVINDKLNYTEGPKFDIASIGNENDGVIL